MRLTFLYLYHQEMVTVLYGYGALRRSPPRLLLRSLLQVSLVSVSCNSMREGGLREDHNALGIVPLVIGVTSQCSGCTAPRHKGYVTVLGV